MQKNKFGPPPYTILKNLLKIDQRCECKSLSGKTLRRKHKYKSLWHWIIGLGNDFLDITPKAKEKVPWT